MKPPPAKRPKDTPPAKRPEDTPPAKRPRKRQHTEALIAVSAAAAPNYLPVIRSLPAHKLCSLLAHAAQQYPEVGATIVNERNKIIAAERAKTVYLDQYFKMARRALSDVAYKELSGSQDYEKAFEMFSEVQDCIKAVRRKTPAHASLDVKKSALATLQKIGKSISLSHGKVLGHGARKLVIRQFRYDDCLERTMLQIVESMPLVERYAFMKHEFGDKLVELEKLGAEHSLFEKLKDVRLALLSAQGFSDEEEDKDDEDYEDEDEDDETDESDDEESEDDEDMVADIEESEDDEESGDEWELLETSILQENLSNRKNPPIVAESTKNRPKVTESKKNPPKGLST